MADDTNAPLYGTPAVSPEALKYRRILAQELMKQGTDASPIRSPWQGAARLAQTLVGALAQSKYDTSEKEAREKQIKDVIEAMQSGDRARMAGAALNPYTPEALSHVALERSFPAQMNNGAYNYPANQISGQAMPGGVARVPEGTVQTGPVSEPGYGQPAGTPPPGGAPPPRGPMAGAPPVPVPTPRPAGAPQAQPTQPQAGGARTDPLIERGVKAQNAFEEAKAKMGTLMGLQNRGLESKQKLDEFGQFTRLAENAKFGLTAELKTWAANHGFQTSGVPVEQLYTDLIKFYGPQLRPEGSGGMRGPELGGFYNSLGGLMRTPEGRQAGMSFISRSHQWNAAAGSIAGDARIDPDERLRRINEMKVPDIDIGRLAKPSREEAIQELRKRGVGGF